MIVRFGNYRLERHDSLNWTISELRMTVPRGKNKDVEPREKWCRLDRYFQKVEDAVAYMYEHEMLSDMSGDEITPSEFLAECRRIKDELLANVKAD